MICRFQFAHVRVPSFVSPLRSPQLDRARDLFYALWVSDIFMERVQSNGDWTLMCPNECPGLADSHGAAHKALYEKYEREGKGRR